MSDEDQSNDSEYYKLGAKYWENVEPTVDGMLGGFGKISSTDIEGSNKLLKSLLKMDHGPGNGRALDCGAGIGRITKYLLQRHFKTVDLVEQNQLFVDQVKGYLGTTPHLGNLYCSGLQDFTPEPGIYDVIWCQWVLGHLTDKDLQKFFERCAVGLKPNGILVVKENTTSSGQVEKDDEDSSVTRPDSLLKEIFQRAGLTLLRDLKQQKFPQELFPVKMYALKPNKNIL